MKSLKILVPLAFLLCLIVPMALLAQDSSDGVTLSEAIALVQAQYGSSVFIREVSYDAEGACWKFHLADNSEFCVDEMTGEFTFDDNSAEATAELTPEATDDSPDDANDDNGNDGQEDESDDDNGNDAIPQTPTVSLEEAIAMALTIYPDGVVTDAELEDFEDNFLVWDIELEGGRSVDVDALTGEVLSFGYESDDDNSYSEDDSNDEQDDSRDDNGGSSHDSNDDNGDDNSGSNSDDDSNDDNGGSSHDSNDDNGDDNSGHGSDDDNSGSGSDDNSDDGDDD